MAKNGRSFALSLHTHPSAVGLGHAFEREEELILHPVNLGHVTWCWRVCWEQRLEMRMCVGLCSLLLLRTLSHRAASPP